MRWDTGMMGIKIKLNKKEDWWKVKSLAMKKVEI